MLLPVSVKRVEINETQSALPILCKTEYLRFVKGML